MMRVDKTMSGRARVTRYALAIGLLSLPVLLVVLFWASLLLDNGSGVIPNYHERMTMFRSLLRRPRGGGPWLPRQGENWIF